jgi:hypothetical protein
MKTFNYLLLILVAILFVVSCRKSVDVKKPGPVGDPNYAKIYTDKSGFVSDSSVRISSVDSATLVVNVSGGARPLFITVSLDNTNTAVIDHYIMNTNTQHTFVLAVNQTVWVFVTTNTGLVYTTPVGVVTGQVVSVGFSLPD